ncbi:glycosyltransferase involved in cell wall biosynthesis [Salinibacter ruber]|uniref:glycosyltransferase family 4 protein n=1 Tax=Salinibacter ruber TaxID=146919 RepID=UPI002166DB76|nr:glycosyltransferase involved in cell wall biosynthesis [Salinibacter ruber]
MNLAVIFFRFGPYHLARLRAVGAIVELTAIEASGRTAEYDWDVVEAAPNFNRLTLFPDGRHREQPLPELRARMDRALSEANPDAVAIPGWDDPAALSALRWCQDHGVPTIVMSASTALDTERRWWREAVKGRVVRNYDAGLGGGTRHAEYLQTLGMPPGRTFTGYNVVDNSHFAEGARSARADAEALRREYELPARYFLAVGRFIPKKNLDGLLRAYSRYRDRADDPWALVVLGNGPLDDDVRRWRRELDLDEHVFLPGFKQYDELPVYYGLADAFVHASRREQWGLVVNEAMAAGLPVVVSDRCGCAPDLVEEGRNGFSFSPSDDDALTDALVRIASPDCDRAAMGGASREIIADWTPETFARQLLRAARAAREHVNSSSEKTSWFDTLLLEALMRR